MQVIRADGLHEAGAVDHAQAEPARAPMLEAAVSPEFPLVLVEWHDAWFDFDLEEADARRSDYVVRTVGFLVGEDPRCLSVAQEVLPDGEGFRAVTHIPIPVVERLVRFGTLGGFTSA